MGFNLGFKGLKNKFCSQRVSFKMVRTDDSSGADVQCSDSQVNIFEDEYFPLQTLKEIKDIFFQFVWFFRCNSSHTTAEWMW